MASMMEPHVDRAFARHMAEDHQKAIDMFTDKADDEKNEITAFAEKNLPVLRQHLEQAKTLPGASG
jgi:putative membrane protein